MTVSKIIIILCCFGTIMFNNSKIVLGKNSTYDEIIKHLGSKTPYRISHNRYGAVDTEYAKCAKKIWMLVGHGTSYATESDISEMDNYLLDVKSKILQTFSHVRNIKSPRKIELFKQWRPHPSSPDDVLKLVQEGETEMKTLGERMQAKYPQLFPRHFDNHTYLFKYVPEDVVRQSARYFVFGLFGKEEIRDAYFAPPTDQDLRIIRPWSQCFKWLEEVKTNPGATVEKDMFFDSQFISDAVEELANYLSVTGLQREDVKAMYTACAYETAWSKRSRSPWCSSLDLKTMKTFEYLDDLESYWVNGYGNKISYQQSCLAMKDLILFFNDRTNKRTSHIYFTDPESVTSFIAHLGLYKTPRLTHQNFDPGIARAWKSNKVSSFGTNVALILYSCENKKFVSVLHNEQFVQLPACRDKNKCPFAKFKKYYQKSVNRCDFDKICENDD